MLNNTFRIVTINGIQLKLIQRQYDAIIEIPHNIIRQHPRFLPNLCKRLTVTGINLKYKDNIYATCHL